MRQGLAQFRQGPGTSLVASQINWAIFWDPDDEPYSDRTGEKHDQEPETIRIPVASDVLCYVMGARFHQAKRFARSLLREGEKVSWIKDPRARWAHCLKNFPIRYEVVERYGEMLEGGMAELEETSDTETVITHVVGKSRAPRKDYREVSVSQFSMGHTESDPDSDSETISDLFDSEDDDIDLEKPPLSLTRSPSPEGSSTVSSFYVPPVDPKTEDEGWGAAFGAAAFLLLIAFMVSSSRD